MYIHSLDYTQTKKSKMIIDDTLESDLDLNSVKNKDKNILKSDTETETEIKLTYLVINENDVSKILSCPTDSNIMKILKYIQENSLEKSYEYITNIINSDGISLVELISCFYEYFMDSIINNNKSIIKYDNSKSVEIIKNMSMINENLSYCNNDNIQIISFISLFYS